MQRWLSGVVLGLLVPATAAAAPIVLTFEGVGNLASVLAFYDGGTDSAGNTGPDIGVAFLPGALGIIDSDQGGTGNIANEPSGRTVLFFQDIDAAVMTVAAGFDAGFSFYYSGNIRRGAGTVAVFDGEAGSGNVLASATLDVTATPTGGCRGGDPFGDYSCWRAVGLPFDGLARSVVFGGAANYIAFDNVTFGAAAPFGSSDVPEPGAAWLAVLGAGMLTRRLTRRR
jgi:hypothetical protein